MKDWRKPRCGDDEAVAGSPAKGIKTLDADKVQ